MVRKKYKKPTFVKKELKVQLFSRYSRMFGFESETLLLAQGSGGGIVCILPGTKILLSDGTIKKIENIQKKDQIMSLNVNTSQYVSNTVAKVVEHYKETYEYVVINNELSITKNHEVWVNNSTWKRVEELRLCDLLHVYKKGLVPIQNLEVVQKDVELVYNLELDGEPGNYFADSVCIHW